MFVRHSTTPTRNSAPYFRNRIFSVRQFSPGFAIITLLHASLVVLCVTFSSRPATGVWCNAVSGSRPCRKQCCGHWSSLQFAVCVDSIRRYWLKRLNSTRICLPIQVNGRMSTRKIQITDWSTGNRHPQTMTRIPPPAIPVAPTTRAMRYIPTREVDAPLVVEQ